MPQVTHPRELTTIVLVALAVFCSVRVARADEEAAPAAPFEQTPRFGPLLGGGAMLDSDKTPPGMYLFPELGGSLRMDVDRTFHGVFEAWFQHRTTSPNESVVNNAQGEQTKTNIHYRFDILGARLLAGWWVSRPLAFRAGLVVGHAWSKIYNDACGDVSIGRAAFGPTFGMAYAFGARKEIEVSVLIEAIRLPRVWECRTANGHSELTLAGGKLFDGVWGAALGRASYFF